MMIDFDKSFVFDTVPFHKAFSWEEICYFDYSSNTGIKHVRMSLFLLWYCLNIQELTKYSEAFLSLFREIKEVVFCYWSELQQWRKL